MTSESNFLPAARDAVYRHVSEAKYLRRSWTRCRWTQRFGRFYTLLLQLNDLRADAWNSVFPAKASASLISEAQVKSRLPLYEFLWHHLARDEEKDLLLKIFALRMLCLGHTPVPVEEFDWTRMRPKPPYPSHSPFACTQKMVEIKNPSEFAVDVARLFQGAPNITVRSEVECLFGLFLFAQYQHPLVRPAAGDVCIDCGAFAGETSIWMAALAGQEGRCYAIEMMPDNVKRIHENLQLNPEVAKRVEIIQSPLGSEDGVEVSVRGSGTMARLVFGHHNSKSHVRIGATATLDTLVQRHGIPRVDFVKMDVEGAEPAILQGATETMRQFRPKLAISLYHDDRDFDRIPRFIDSLGLGYEFYLGHHYVNWAETVLYARVP